jgi:hypothetical protein
VERFKETFSINIRNTIIECKFRMNVVENVSRDMLIKAIVSFDENNKPIRITDQYLMYMRKHWRERNLSIMLFMTSAQAFSI